MALTNALSLALGENYEYSLTLKLFHHNFAFDLPQLFPSTSFVRSFALQAPFCHDEDPNSSTQASVFLKSAQILFQEANSFHSRSFHFILWVSFGLQMSHVIVNNEVRMLPRNRVFSTEEFPHLC